MSDTQTQAPAVRRAPVLMPALVIGTFDYRVPADAAPGTLVEATLAGKTRIGAVWDGPTDAAVPDTKIKPVHRALDLPPLKPAFRRFIDWVADYTLAPKGAVLSLCGLSHAAKTTRTRYLQPAFVPNLPVLNTDQQQAFQEMLDAWQSNPSAPKPLVLDGVTGSGKTEVYFHAIAQVLGLEGDVSNSGGDALPSAPKARARSEGVASATSEGRRDAPFTPLAAKINTKQILVLVPEIALTHQWFERFEKAFGAPAAVWHSQQTPAARARVWQAVARGEARIVIGARSALFLPFADLGLIVVDEEHDPSYKQEDGVLYHARDMAVVRARFEQVPVLLVSATPSLETMVNIEEGKYQALHLTQRYGAAGMPTVALLDMRNDPPERGDFLSPLLKQAMLDTLARGEQVLLFLNRRGYAPLLLCRACGHRFQCSDCSAWLVVHGSKDSVREGTGEAASRTRSESEPLEGVSGEAATWSAAERASVRANGGLPPSTRSARTYLSCHHCNHREPFPKECPSCKADAEKLAACGPGVERIADEVRAMFHRSTTSDAGPPPNLPLGRGRDDGGSAPSHASGKDDGDSTPPPARGEAGRGPSIPLTFPPMQTRNNARALRKRMTDAEKKLWQGLRRDQLQTKFRKQCPIGPYIVDFAALESMLIVELDGGQHNDLDAAAYDRERTIYLEAQGFTVVRFWNNEVLENSEAVVEAITKKLTLASPPPNLPHPNEGVRIAVLSSDEAVAAEDWAAIERGEVDIIVGTQMVAKGHHFPRLTLVGVVDADLGLQGADLRAGERTYQLLHQLGGRAGRGDMPGQVLIQTYEPNHAVMQALAAQDREAVLRLERAARMQGGWPPYGMLAAILLDGVNEAEVRRAAQQLAQRAPQDARVQVLGPAPAPLSRLRGQYRYRLLVKMQPGIHPQRTLRAWLDGARFKGVRIKIDVNPYYFL